jgi:hypothetical protein
MVVAGAAQDCSAPHGLASRLGEQRERAEQPRAARHGLTKHSFGISYDSNSEFPSILPEFPEIFRNMRKDMPLNASINA